MFTGQLVTAGISRSAEFLQMQQVSARPLMTGLLCLPIAYRISTFQQSAPGIAPPAAVCLHVRWGRLRPEWSMPCLTVHRSHSESGRLLPHCPAQRLSTGLECAGDCPGHPYVNMDHLNKPLHYCCRGWFSEHAKRLTKWLTKFAESSKGTDDQAHHS